MSGSNLPAPLVRFLQLTDELIARLPEPPEHEEEYSERFLLNHEDLISSDCLEEIEKLSPEISGLDLTATGIDRDSARVIRSSSDAIIWHLYKYWDAYQGDITIDGHGGSFNEREKYLARLFEDLFKIKGCCRQFA